MRVAPSTYYAARTRALSARSVRDEALMRVMRQVWKENYCVFGVRKMHAFLNTHELGVGYVARHGRETDVAYGHSWCESALGPPCQP